MDIIEFRDYCLAKPGVSESFPFGPDTLVFKVGGKMFALCNVDNFESINVKCDPERAIELRSEYEEHIKPGFHMNKKHWNTIRIPYFPNTTLLKELIDHSYTLVLEKLPKAIQVKLKSGI